MSTINATVDAKKLEPWATTLSTKGSRAMRFAEVWTAPFRRHGRLNLR